MERVAVICLHTCPLGRLGLRDSGGMNVYVRNLARELGRQGLAVDIFTRAHDSQHPPVITLSPNARLIHLRAGPTRLLREKLVPHLPAFLDRLRQFQHQQGLHYDLVHSHYWLSAWVGRTLAQEWTVPHVVTFHTLTEVKQRARVGEKEEMDLRGDTERELIASATGIVVATPHEKQLLRSLYRAPEEKVHVIPEGVDLSLFQPGSQQAARRRLGLNGHRTVLYVGRLEPLKGLDLLLEAFASVEEPETPELLIVGGDGEESPEEHRLRQRAQELGVQGQVQFLGSRQHELLPLYYQAADVCALPSHYESFGLVALEAMACGTPVVASRVGGLPRVVKNGHSGFLVSSRCPDAFGDRLEVLLANAALGRAMGRTGRSIAQGMSWETTAVRMRALYTALVASGPTPRGAP